MNSQPVTLKTESLVKIYRKRQVVNHVSLELKQGEVVGLLGPNGAGKTTTFYMITGMIRPNSGRIFFNGQDITQFPMFKRARMGIGYLSQEPSVFRKLTVEENVMAILETLPLSKSERENRLRTLLEDLSITHLAQQKAYTLSGGERKKTAIARSLIIQPQLLLLDEPLGMLDHNGRKEMLDILKMIHTDLQTTTIHITHDRHEAWSIARVCAVMNNGRIIQRGSVAELFRKPATLFVAEFLGSCNIFKATFKDKIQFSYAVLKRGVRFDQAKYTAIENIKSIPSKYHGSMRVTKVPQ